MFIRTASPGLGCVGVGCGCASCAGLGQAEDAAAAIDAPSTDWSTWALVGGGILIFMWLGHKTGKGVERVRERALKVRKGAKVVFR